MSHNSLNRFDQPLQIEPRASRAMRAVLVSLHVLAAAAWWQLPLSLWARALVSIVLAVHFVHLYRLHITASSATAVKALSWDRARGWRLCSVHTSWVSAQLCIPVFVSYHLVVVRFRTARFRTCTLALSADRLGADDFRRLRVRLLQSVHGDRDREDFSVAQR